MACRHKTIRLSIPLSLIYLLGALVLPDSPANAIGPKAVYQQLCSFCHDDGLLGSPRKGDNLAWRERLERGRDVLYESALDGFGHMPSRRGRVNIFDRRRGQFTDDDIKAAVDYLLEQSGCGGNSVSAEKTDKRDAAC